MTAIVFNFEAIAKAMKGDEWYNPLSDRVEPNPPLPLKEAIKVRGKFKPPRHDTSEIDV